MGKKPLTRQTLITQFVARTEGGTRGHRGEINDCDFCGRSMNSNPSTHNTSHNEKDSWGFCCRECRKSWSRAFKLGHNSFIW